MGKLTATLWTYHVFAGDVRKRRVTHDERTKYVRNRASMVGLTVSGPDLLVVLCKHNTSPTLVLTERNEVNV